MLKDFLPLEGGAGCCTVTSEWLRIGFLQYGASQAFVRWVPTEQSYLTVTQDFGRYIKCFFQMNFINLMVLHFFVTVRNIAVSIFN